MSGSAPLVGPVMRELSAYMAEAASRRLPAEVVEKAKHHLLDTLAAMVSGSRLPPGVKAIAFARSQGGRREAGIAGSRVVTTAINAATANGMLAHADETDDSHAPSFSHPGCAVVPAALAVAERGGRSGDALLKAVVLGYDVGCRTTMTLGVEQFYGGHKSTHSVAALFGAAAAAGAVAGLDADRMRWLLAYAAQQSSGIATWQRDEEHVEKAFDFGGMPARNGVAAALMVAAGFTGVEDVFSGPHNFFEAYAPGADPSGMVRDLGRRYEVMHANIKKWPVGSPVQAPLEALSRLVRDHALAPAAIARITVRVAAKEARIVDGRPMPDICLQHLLALLLVDGAVTFRAAHDYGRLTDPAVLGERAKIELIHDAELELDLPRRRAVVELTTRDGRRLVERVDAVRGTSDNPMDRREVEAKCLDLVGEVAGAAAARRLIDAVWGLERVGDARDLRPLLQARPAGRRRAGEHERRAAGAA